MIVKNDLSEQFDVLSVELIWVNLSFPDNFWVQKWSIALRKLVTFNFQSFEMQVLFSEPSAIFEVNVDWFLHNFLLFQIMKLIF